MSNITAALRAHFAEMTEAFPTRDNARAVRAEFRKTVAKDEKIGPQLGKFHIVRNAHNVYVASVEVTGNLGPKSAAWKALVEKGIYPVLIRDLQAAMEALKAPKSKPAEEPEVEGEPEEGEPEGDEAAA